MGIHTHPHIQTMIRNAVITAALAAGAIAMPADSLESHVKGMLKNYKPHHAYGPVGADPEGWTWVEVPGTQCMLNTTSPDEGDVTGYYYRAGQGEDSDKKLVVYLMPGGACFNGMCDELATNDPKGSYPPSNAGIFSLTSEDNPLRDYSWVFIPYCSGDVFLGEAEGPTDTKIGGAARFFKGRSNLELQMAKVYKDITIGQSANGFVQPDLDTFVLTGESAGSFGAVGNYQWFRTNYVADATSRNAPHWTSENHVMIADSGIPLDDDHMYACLQSFIRDLWVADSALSECAICKTDQGGGIGNIWEWLHTTYPQDRFGILSAASDEVISLFYAFGKPFLGGGCPGIIPNILDHKRSFKAGLTTLYKKSQTWNNPCHYIFDG